MADDVYDGVFDKVLITGNTGVEKEQVLYDERLQGISGFLAIVERAWYGVLAIGKNIKSA